MPDSGNRLNVIYERNADTVLRRVSGEYVLVPICRRASSVERMFTLNETGGMILESLDGNKPLEQILNSLLDAFDVERSVAVLDLCALIDDLERIGAVCRVKTAAV